ncbi:MAG: apolipoprotein N-acyltransferase, partial [Geodermatophilaceae bacterium]|nr:apolipoprotein N-acyltransferase [Geodermatophilaceae bacterium]
RRSSAALLLAALAVPAVGWILPVAGDAPAGTPTATIALIQGDVPEPGLNFNATRRAVLDNHVRQTLDLAERIQAGTESQPDLVIWPENSSDIDPYRNADAAEQIQRAVAAVGVPILVGAVRVNDDDTLSNVGIVWAPVTGPGQNYVKRHPVPFGEYIPFRDTLEKLFPIVNEVPRDFVGGDEVGLLDADGIQIGDVICFEVAYDGLVRDVVDAGAEVLVVQTNNATFGYTDETYQQLAMGRIRAVEHGRSVLVVSTSGVSAVIDADGSVQEASGLFVPATFVAEIPLRTDRTLASRLGVAPEWVMIGFAVLALVGGAARHSPPPRRLSDAARARRGAA